MMKLPYSLFRNRFLQKDLIRRICSLNDQFQRLKVCVVGSGPAGFYTAKKLIKENENIEVDIYEKLPVPFGLIRYGVAPDHPEIKIVTEDFDNVASCGRCNFYGNVHVGKDVFVPELLSAYNAVVLSYGASSHNALEIPGEDLNNVVSANSFVGWFNGFPENVADKINLDTEVAAVIGQGNIALDIARILLRKTDELKKTEITNYALAALEKSKIKKVMLIGRRGPLNAAFGISEFREMTNLVGCKTIMHPEDFEGVADLLPSMKRGKRMTELMLQIVEISTKPHLDSRQLDVKFFRSPKLLLPDSNNKVEKLLLTVNKLEGSPDSGKIVGTDNEEVIDCGLVIKSIGFRSAQIDPSVPFDTVKCTIPHERGKVVGEKCNGLYCSGWLKTGPIGVIPKTLASSYETAQTILSDLQNGRCSTERRPGSSGITPLLGDRKAAYISFDAWRMIDNYELESGKAVGKPREKVVNVEEMLDILGLCSFL